MPQRSTKGTKISGKPFVLFVPFVAYFGLQVGPGDRVLYLNPAVERIQDYAAFSF